MKTFLVKFFFDGNHQTLIAQTHVSARSPSDALREAREVLKQTHPEVAMCKYQKTEMYQGKNG
jgi:hypothetical protein